MASTPPTRDHTRPAAAPWTVRAATWAADAAALRAVRTAVFIVEQQVPEALEWDDDDATAMHALAIDAAGHAIGTARRRIDPDGAMRIGRMAVRREWRGRGVGAALLRFMLDAADRDGGRDAVLSAQVHAIGFYARFGFVAEGPEYDDAGIAHRTMRRRLKAHATPARG